MRAKLRLTFVGIMMLTAVGAYAQKGVPTGVPSERAAVSGMETSPPDLNAIISRMQTAMEGLNHDRAYSVTREYTLTPENPGKSARVVAQINTVASGKKDFTITEGSGQAESVVRKVLDHEADASTRHNNVDISPANYDFQYLGTELLDGHLCFVLGLKPHHDAKDLLKGRAWVDSGNYLIRQVAGSPTKSPSWWIKDVQITLHYRDVQGVWLQDSGQAIAEVRLVGTHTLTSRALDVRTDTAMASKSAPRSIPRKRSHNTDPALLGAGVFSHR